MYRRPKALLPAGLPAPDFSLRDTPEDWVSLADFAGSPVVLLFYAADFHPVCTRQITVFNEVLPEFHRRGAQVLGISPDAIWSHIAFSRHYNVHFPLLSDYYPRSGVARLYKVPVRGGEPARAVYVIDSRGVIVWSQTAPDDVALAAKGAFEAVESL